MPSRHLMRRTLKSAVPVALLGALLPAVLLTPMTALAPVAFHAAAAPSTGDYSGTGTAQLVGTHVLKDVLGASGALGAQCDAVKDLVCGAVGIANAAVNTKGIPAGDAIRSHADARDINADVANLTGGTPVVTKATQDAPPDNPVAATSGIVSLPLSPAATANVQPQIAHARWAGDNACVTNGPITDADSRLANLDLLEVVAPALVSVGRASDPHGTVSARSNVTLVGGGAKKSVQTTSFTDITNLTIAGMSIVAVADNGTGDPGPNGTPSGLTVRATASGTPGGAHVLITQPVLYIAGNKVVDGQTLAPVAIPGAPVIELHLGQTVSKNEGANGQSASGEAYLLKLDVLSAGGTVVASETIGDVKAAATAPNGGVNCSPPVTPPPTGPNPLSESYKDVTATSVNAGQTFDYTIRIPNRGTCDIQDVKVTDTTGGPFDHPLQLVKAVPSTPSTSSPYSFDLGTIHVNEFRQIVLTFRVPADAPIGAHYSNSADISGTCNGKPVTATVDADGPTVDGPGLGGCDLSRSTKFASNTSVKQGEDFGYFVNVFNQGGAACTHVILKDTLPAGSTFSACSPTCTHSGQDVTFALGDLAPGASTVVSIIVTATGEIGTKLPNTADITADAGTPGHPSTAGPIIAGVSVGQPGVPASRLGTPPAGPGGGLANTGLNTLVAWTSLGLIAAALGIRRIKGALI